jgi:hypothetical protein
LDRITGGCVLEKILTKKQIREESLILFDFATGHYYFDQTLVEPISARALFDEAGMARSISGELGREAWFHAKRSDRRDDV